MRVLAILAAVLFVSPALANVKYFPKSSTGGATIAIFGDLSQSDIDAFAKALAAVEQKDEAVVTLDSEGGEAWAGLVIGDLVRKSGISTFVADNRTCSSACSIIWIAGAKKWAGAYTHIGFHGNYDERSGQPSPIIRTLLGAHYAYLGYGQDAILWVVSARPLDMHWLTPELGAKYGIYFDYDKSKTPPGPPSHEYVYPAPPPLPPPALPPAAPQWKYTVFGTNGHGLNLRELPNMNSDNKLARWAPNDSIAEGTEFTFNGKPGGNICTLGPGGYIWCKLAVRRDNEEIHGWASAHFLVSPTGEKLACLFQNPDPDCNRQHW